MAKRNMFLGMLVLVLTFGLALGGCNNSTSGNDAMTNLILIDALTGGRLTVINIPAEYNGHAAQVRSSSTASHYANGESLSQAGDWFETISSYPFAPTQGMTQAQLNELLPVVSNGRLDTQLGVQRITHEWQQEVHAGNNPAQPASTQYRGNHNVTSFSIYFVNKETQTASGVAAFGSVQFANGSATLDWNNRTNQ